MMIPSNYSINISRATPCADGKTRQLHWGRLELGDISETEALSRYNIAALLFDVSDGFELHLDYITCSGKQVATTSKTRA